MQHKTLGITGLFGLEAKVMALL